MGVGHAAVALGASRIEPRVNVGWLIFAAFLADFLLWIFVPLGLEQIHVPADFTSRHYLTFTFPYSHGLVSLLLWGILLGAMLCWFDRQDRKRAFLVVVTLVLSHFILDGLVHVPELPLLGQNSPTVGLGLWNYMPFELALETLMAALGLALYWKIGGSRVSRWGVAGATLLLTGLTWSQLWITKPPPPSRFNWIIPLAFAAIPYAFDRNRAAAAHDETAAAQSA